MPRGHHGHLLELGFPLQRVLSSFRLNGFRKGLHRPHVSSHDSLLCTTFRLYLVLSDIAALPVRTVLLKNIYVAKLTCDEYLFLHDTSACIFSFC